MVDLVRLAALMERLEARAEAHEEEMETIKGRMGALIDTVKTIR
jgi:hypothetical protein